MPTKQIGTGEFGESVEIHPSDTGDIVLELDGHTVARRFPAMADARRYCRQAFGVTTWATYPLLVLLVLLGACSLDAVPFGGAELGGAGGLSRGAGGEATGGSTGAAGGSGGVLSTGGTVASTGGAVATTGGAPGTGGAMLPGSGGSAGGGASGMGGVGGKGGMGGTPIVWGSGGHATTPDDCYDKTKFWNAQNDQYMRSGSACNSCHQFTIAGTVFVQPTEPDNCYGVDGAKHAVAVLVVGADARAVALKTNEAGNFWTNVAVAFPATVSVTYGSGELRMQATVVKGDCNSCHTASAFPGRILPP